MTKHEDIELNQAVKRVFADVARNAERAGRDNLNGLVCFFCGSSAPETKISRCSCSFPEHFGCGIRGRTICADCERAHREVAAHLNKIFAAPICNRVSAKRFKYWHQLSRAVRSLYPEDTAVTAIPLFSALANCDEWDSDKDTFRSQTLRAFREVRFLDFQRLAKNLKQEEMDSLLRAVVRSGLAR